MRKRNIFIGLIALEILALPAAAHLHANLKLTDRTHVIAAEIKSPAGFKRYFVSSDGPFTVTAKDLKGRIYISVFEAGIIGETSFGENAQLPGPPSHCAQTSAEKEQIIYGADRGTIKNTGDAVSQAVMFSISYTTGFGQDLGKDLGQEIEPSIDFKPVKTSEALVQASTCI